MTENKAINEIIKEVCSGCYGSDEEPHRCSTCGFKMAKDALKEIQAYRAIGTVEELQRQKDYIDTINEVYSGYSAIGTIEEFKALKEKNEPKKVTNIQKSESPEDIEYMGEDTLYGYCPCCEEYNNNVWNEKNCGECGQKLDWDKKGGAT